MTRYAFIVAAYQLPRWQSLYLSVADQFIKSGIEPVIVDISRLNFPSWETLHSRLLSTTKKFPSYKDFALGRGIRTIELSPTGSHGDFALSEANIVALNSQLGSYLRDDRPDASGAYMRLMRRRLHTNARLLRGQFGKLLREYSPVEVVIPNGRLFLQSVLAQMCRDEFQAIRVSFTEVGHPGFGFYWEDFPIHDRELTQELSIRLTSQKESGEVLDFANAWLSKRLDPGSGQNTFSKGFKQMPDIEAVYAGANVLFTSSTDEFWSLGPKWEEAEWGDQYHAFATIVRALTKSGERCVIRVHPNLQNKSFRHFKRELRKLLEIRRELGCEIIPPWSSVDSYGLVKIAKRIVVSRSMLGFEAQLLGTRVWLTASSDYDQLADVTRVFGESDLLKSLNEDSSVKPDSYGSAIHVFGQHFRGHSYTVAEDAFADFDLALFGGNYKLSYLPGRWETLHFLHLIGFAFRKVTKRVYAFTKGFN